MTSTFNRRAWKSSITTSLDPDQRGHTRKTFVGTLLGLDGDQVRLEQSDKTGGLIVISLAEIDKANLEEDV